MAELKRKAYDELLRWKARKNHKPLIIEGLRQVGKSFLALRFAEDNYQNVIVFDFRHDPSLEAIFENKADQGKMSVDSIIEHASLHFLDAKFIPGETCLVFDEIGDSALARESLKLFALDGRYDVIATGSLLGIQGLSPNPKRNTPVGYEEYLELTALDFEEFLWANGISMDAIATLKDKTAHFQELDEDYHQIFTSYLTRYILLGGMPEVLNVYLENQNLADARTVQKLLLKDYESDFGKKVNRNDEAIIDATLLIRTMRAFRSIPDQLSKENKKFQYSAIEHGGRSSEFSDALAWLDKTQLIALAYNLRAVELPLLGNRNIQEFKVYPTDIGLLMAMFPDPIVSEVLDGNYQAYKGAIFEALVADMLFKAGFPLFYYSNSSKHREIDFFLEEKEGISIVECKSSNGKIPATKEFIAAKESEIHRVYKIIKGNFSSTGFYRTLPHYAFPFLLEQIQEAMKKSMELPPLPKI